MNDNKTEGATQMIAEFRLLLRLLLVLLKMGKTSEAIQTIEEELNK